MYRTAAGFHRAVAPFLLAAVFLSGCAGNASKSGGGTPAPPPAAIAVSVTPPSATVLAGQTQTLTATVANDSANKGVSWTVSGAGCSGAACGSVSPTSTASAGPVTYTAPMTLPSPASVTVTATSMADGTKSASTTVTLMAPISVTLSSTTASLTTGTSQQFTATVQGDSAGKGVSWALSGAGCSAATCGTLSAASSASGAAITYAAPPTAPSSPVTLTATSVADATKSASATITVTAPPPIVVLVSPATASVNTSATQLFTATVQLDTAGKGVTWALSGACSGVACGALSATSSASGVAVTYTAPANVPSPPTVTLTATSVADTTKSASSTITITPAPAPIAVTVTPLTVNVAVNATQKLTATLQNDTANKGVTWTLLGASCTESTCGTVSPITSESNVPVIYTAPATVPTPAAIMLRATSVADNTKSDTATITVTPAGPAVTVDLTPKRGGLTLGQTLNFTATVSNDGQGQGVTWSASAGTFPSQTTTTATFQAPTAAGPVTITATSVADVTVKASTTIGVTDLAGVYTYHNDNSRNGANAQEYALTGPSTNKPSNVSSNTFGKLFSCAVDGAVYAQPLWVANVTINGINHNVIIVATAHDSLYAFDADASPCVTYWHANLIDGMHGGTAGETPVPSGGPGALVGGGYGDITPETGVIGTPVIDKTTNTIYVVSKSVIVSGPTFFQRLHAINLATGAENLSPVNMDATITYPGTGDGGTSVSFNPSVELQRAGLALVNGVVYVCWAAHEDAGHYYGWMAGYRTSDLALVTTYNVAPDNASGGGGIWMGGGAPAADDSGNTLYIVTGNAPSVANVDLSDSFVKLSTSPKLTVVDSFTPFNQGGLNNTNKDLGAGGAALLITLPSQRQLIFGGGKEGKVYVIDPTAMGGYQGPDGPDKIVQEFAFNYPIFSTAAYWQNTLYLAGLNGPLQALALDPTTDLFGTTPASVSPSNFGFPGSTPSISSSGTTNGIVWALDNGAYCTGRAKTCGPAVLHAYDATNLGTELWNSGVTAGNAVKFTVPTIANGKVYVGTRGSSTNGGGVGELEVYGLLPN